MTEQDEQIVEESPEELNLMTDVSTAKNYVINFSGGQKLEMVCFNGNHPIAEVEKMANPAYPVADVTTYDEVEEFPADPE